MNTDPNSHRPCIPKSAHSCFRACGPVSCAASHSQRASCGRALSIHVQILTAPRPARGMYKRRDFHVLHGEGEDSSSSDDDSDAPGVSCGSLGVRVALHRLPFRTLFS